MERLCDILNSQTQRPDTEKLKKTNSTWKFIESFFMDNAKFCKKTELIFMIEENGSVSFSLNSGAEYETEFNKAEVLSCINIAKAHGLGVSRINHDPKCPVWKGIESCITFSFTPSNITDSEE